MNCERMEENMNRLKGLTVRLREGINEICGNAVFPGEGEQLPGFTSVAFPGHSGSELSPISGLCQAGCVLQCSELSLKNGKGNRVESIS